MTSLDLLEWNRLLVTVPLRVLYVNELCCNVQAQAFLTSAWASGANFFFIFILLYIIYIYLTVLILELCLQTNYESRF